MSMPASRTACAAASSLRARDVDPVIEGLFQPRPHGAVVGDAIVDRGDLEAIAIVAFI